ncbi:MAG TPA: helix-turn-helix domain-containing protein [Candidatus Limnocylindrales bacterium]
MAARTARPPALDWLPLGAASRLLGVDGDTLRRWADDGRIEAFATPGGHRRFARRSLERLVAERRVGVRPTLADLGATPDRLTAAFRRRYDHPSPGGGPAVVAALPDRDAFRRDGRRLVEALLAHLDAGDTVERATAEAAAVSIAGDQARRLAAAGVSLADAVAMFVAGREPFLVELTVVARRRHLDANRSAQLFAAASGVLDRILLGFVGAYESARATVGQGQAAPGGDA